MLTEGESKPTGLGAEFDKSFDRKMVDFNYKALALIGAVLYKPLATASDPFFRKNLGERYFTDTSTMLGAFLWVVAGGLGRMTGSFIEKYALNIHSKPLYDFAVDLEKHNFAATLSWFVTGAFFGLACVNLAAAKRRQTTGEPWHSMSRGESLFGRESARRDFFITILVGFFLFLFVPTVGLLFWVSRYLSWRLIVKEQQSMYRRYLDVMDAKIESEYLERALRDGVPPMTTDGIYGPLPKHFKGEHRANVARVAAGGGVSARVVSVPQGAVVRQTPLAENRTPSSVPAGAPTVSPPVVATPVIEPTKSSVEVPRRRMTFPRFSAKQRRGAAILLVGIGLLAGLAYLLQAVSWRNLTARLRPVAVAQPPTPQATVVQPTTAAPIPTTVATPSQSAPLAQTTPEQASPEPDKEEMAQPQQPSLDARVHDEPPASVEVVPVKPPPSPPPLLALAGTPKPQVDLPPAPPAPVDPQATQEARDKEAKTQSILGLLREELAKVREFDTNSQKKLSENAQKIAKLSRSKQKILAPQNDNVRQSVIRVVHNQAAGAGEIQESIVKAPEATLAELEDTSKRVDLYVEATAKQRAAVTSNLDKIAAAALEDSPVPGFLKGLIRVEVK